jgi:hypothetical protein
MVNFVTYFTTIFCVCVSGVCTQGSTLATQVCLSHTSSPFALSYFGDVISQTICPGWPQTSILLIAVSQVARITDVTNQHPAEFLKTNNVIYSKPSFEKHCISIILYQIPFLPKITSLWELGHMIESIYDGNILEMKKQKGKTYTELTLHNSRKQQDS